MTVTQLTINKADQRDIDHYFMGLALEEAKKAFSKDEVPVGAIIVRDAEVVGRGCNGIEGDKDPTAHAEIVAIRAASAAIDSWRLSGLTLYVTLEPCTMCIGAAILARVDRLVFGAVDPKTGAVGSLYNIASEERLNHRIDVLSGVRGPECSELLKRFFKGLRKKGKETALSDNASVLKDSS
ncbi:MAG: tRNA adenosine(34) deaminase TadA [bacterium]|nr:tRNA adenosine(34) deaminase TadA [bacterium]